MFVCVCKAVRSQEVTELIHAGCNTVEAIGSQCGAGTDCGSCVNRLKRMISTPPVQENLPVKPESSEKKAV